MLGDLGYDGEHLGGAEAAIDPHSTNAESREDYGSNFRGRAQEGAAVLLEGHRDEDGQVRVLARRKDGCFRLEKIAHGLNGDEIASRLFCGDGLLGKDVICLVKRHGAYGRQKGPSWSDIAGDIARSRSAGVPCGGGIDLLHRVGTLKLFPVGVEGVRGDHLGTCVDVLTVDGGDKLGMGHVDHVGTGVWNGNAGCLDHGSHGAVLDKEGATLQHVA